MTKHLQYLLYLAYHKWHVWRFGRELSVPAWRLIVHDWTKFLPYEWFPYVERFYGHAQASVDYRRAWARHVHRNDHHWEAWVLWPYGQGGRAVAQPMPDVCRREMLADWRAAGVAQGKGNNTAEWFEKERHRMVLHDETIAWLEGQIYD